MKAIDYFKNYKKLNETETWELSIIRQFESMFKEIKEIQVLRNAQYDDSLNSIFREMNQKSNSFIKMVNLDENRGIVKDSFKLFIEQQMPELNEKLSW